MTRRILLISLVAAMAGFGAAGCVMLQPAPVVPPNLDTYEGLSAAIATGADIIVLDVRTPEETETGMIPRAVNVPIDQLDDAFTRRERKQVYVVYCASGGRSRAAYETLTGNGFDYVFDFGGIGNWQDELDSGCGCPE